MALAAKHPKVSIITCSYNHAHFISKTIESVLAQTFSDWEYIIADDCSTDNSVEVIRQFSDPRIKYFVSPKNNVVETYNKAFEMCAGEYFVSLDSDDVMTPERLAIQIDFLEKHQDVGVLGSWVREINEAGEIVDPSVSIIEKWFNCSIDLNLTSAWVWQNRLNHSSIMMRRALHERVGIFNNRLSRTGDYDFFIRCLKEGVIFEVLPSKLTYYRVHSTNITHQNITHSFYEQLYIHRVHLLPLILSKTDLKAIHLLWHGIFNHAAYRSHISAENRVLYLNDFFNNSFELPFKPNRKSYPAKDDLAHVRESFDIYIHEQIKNIEWAASQIERLEAEVCRLSKSELQLKRLNSDHVEQTRELLAICEIVGPRHSIRRRFFEFIFKVRLLLNKFRKAK